jgi:formiminotetrahydrofolate cyclodeaminase
LRGELSALVEQDARAYEAVLEAYRKPQGSPQEKEERSAAVQNALEGAARVPLEVAEGAVKVQQLLSPLLEKGLGSAASDVGVAAYAAQAALKGASLNVRTNLRSLRDETLAQGLQEQLSSLEQRSGELMASLERELAARV